MRSRAPRGDRPALRRTGALAAVLLTAAVTAGCSSSGAGPTASPPDTSASPETVGPSAPSTPPSPSAPASSASPSAPPRPTGPATTTPSAADPLAGLSLAQRVGQLFMIGTPATAVSPASMAAVQDRHVGGVFLSGRGRAGTAATAQLVARLQAADADGVPLLIATDQEGGQVQVLSGPGFETIPSALEQAALAPRTLQADAARWAAQLRAAGVEMDLGPVSDVVDSAAQAAGNPPIGALQREYGYGAASVTPHAIAVAAGLAAGGVVPVVKHFPGLGAVTGNTDFTAGVTDTTTDAGSPSVQVFAAEIAAGAPAVMVSTAIYARIDGGTQAVFSTAVVTGLLRHRLGFDRVVMTDDLGGAAQVAAVPAAQRGVAAISAGVDVVLVSQHTELLPAMVDAVVARARDDAAFRAQVDAAARRVVALKRAGAQPIG